MKNKFIIKLLTITLSSVLLFSSVACNSESNVPKLPEYSSNKESIDFFAYNGPTDGIYYFDTEKRDYGSFRTVEGYQEYKEAGFDTLYLTDTAAFNVETDVWGDVNKSETYKCFVNATEAGIQKIILEDAKFEKLIIKPNLVGGNKSVYKDESELLDAVYNELKIYCYEKGFYGVKLGDKPKHDVIESYGYVYKAIREATKKLYEEGLLTGKNEGIMKNNGYIAIHVNIAQIDYTGLSEFYAPPLIDDADEEYYDTYKDSYSRYILSMIESCGGGYNEQTKFGIDKISVGINLFKKEKFTDGLYPMLQTIKEICKQEGVELTYVCQSMTTYTADALMYDSVSEAEMTLEIYSALGFGAKSISYYTYMPTANYSTLGEKMLDDGCFVSRDGQKNNVYYYGQQLISEIRAIESILTAYEFTGAKLYTAPKSEFKGNINQYLYTGEDPICDEDGRKIEFDNSYTLNRIKNLTINNDIALVTEYKDSVNDLYMYMVQNIMDPRNSTEFNTAENVTVTFDSSYTYVAEIESGKISYVKLENGVYSKVLSAGYAVFLIPLK